MSHLRPLLCSRIARILTVFDVAPRLAGFDHAQVDDGAADVHFTERAAILVDALFVEGDYLTREEPGEKAPRLGAARLLSSSGASIQCRRTFVPSVSSNVSPSCTLATG